MTSIAIINRSAPHGSGSAQESLDLALAAGSFGQQISLFFSGDGVYQLISDQQPEHIAKRDISKTFGALEFYDIEDIYVCQQSLNARNINVQELCIDVTVLNADAWQNNLSKHNHILSF